MKFLRRRIRRLSDTGNKRRGSPATPTKGNEMFKNRINAIRSMVAAGALTLMASPVFAAVDVGITTAITDGTADGKAIAGALLVFAIAVGVVLYIKRKAG
jgi:hypothetical protein